MTQDQNQKYTQYSKIGWIIYAVLAVVLAAVLVLFVAQDTEEMFFYGMMTVASAYVFRPTERVFGNLIFKFTGVSRPSDKE